MERYVTDKRTGITYELIGDYYLPIDFPMGKPKQSASAELSVSNHELVEEYRQPSDKLPIGRFGRAHEAYLKQHQRHVYSQLVSKGKLGTYLTQIDEQANSMLELLIRQMAEREGVTEQLKATDQMAWIRRMNSIRNRAEEIVNSELIYA